jgi:hypothetical protein
MRTFTPDDFASVLQVLPQTADNVAAAAMLQAMENEATVSREPYTFEVDFSTGAGLLNGQFAAPAPGLTVPGFFLVDSSSPFMLVAGTYRADVAGAAQASGALITPNALVFISDQSSNRNWMQLPVPVPSLFGQSGSLPYFWPQPRLIPANTNIQVSLSNYDAAITNNIRLQFHGYRLYASR